MNLRSIKRRHDARTKRTLALWALYSGAHDEWYDPEDDDEMFCTRCAGSGYHDADDPINDDVDEFGQVECDYCNGTGLREHQSIF